MKTLVIIASGVADRPQEDLGGRTPLEASQTPALDRLARDGRLGRLLPCAEDVRPEEGAFALAMYGIDPRAHPEIGACLDAAAFDVPVASLDQVFRLSLVTAHEDTIFDPTAGHVSREEAVLLLQALADGVGDSDLVFLPGDGWRNLLVWRGARDVRVRTVPPYEVVGRSIAAAFPRGTGTFGPGGTPNYDAPNFFGPTANTLTITMELPSTAITLPGGSAVGFWGRSEFGGVQIDRMGRPAINTVFNTTDADKDAFNAGYPVDDQANFRANVVGTLLALGNDQATADGLADFLLPDIITIDLAQPSAFPNGRALSDDVIDTELNLITGGAVPSDCVANDNRFVNHFPYLGRPNR